MRRIEGITSERPALAAQLPTLKGMCVLLDAGANVDVRPEWLAQFALMGSIYAEIALGRQRPTVATLSNGEEEGKGNATLGEAVPLIRALPINYVGNIEGKDVTAGNVDVVVVDGFAGNIFLKGAEGVVATMTEMIRAGADPQPRAHGAGGRAATGFPRDPPPPELRGVRRRAAARGQRGVHRRPRALDAAGHAERDSGGRAVRRAAAGREDSRAPGN